MNVSIRTAPSCVALICRAEGSRWKNPALARVLRRIASGGRDGFYTGDTAALIVDEMKKGGGIITREDLERYQPRWRDPVAFTARSSSPRRGTRCRTSSTTA